ncbi:hypothetical protein [Synechococcus sp. GFB01]|uniref:FitA-like ribbon-helix-helix domain-containing protein n=1 Tax=Synechococcus sp. GFB01 TaxID=1662190 RepID=UPI000B128D51|nr:hypothetical protein [Synechococcus sp. GFB01]
MADLLVRGVDEALVQALKQRAGTHGRSVEAEHRSILAAALLTPPARNWPSCWPPCRIWVATPISRDRRSQLRRLMVVVDTNVISEARKAPAPIPVCAPSGPMPPGTTSHCFSR